MRPDEVALAEPRELEEPLGPQDAVVSAEVMAELLPTDFERMKKEVGSA